MKILFSAGRTRDILVNAEVKELEEAGFTIYTLRHDTMSKEDLYHIVTCLEGLYDILFVTYSNPYSKEFLDSLKIKKVYYDGDCPYNESGKNFYSDYDTIYVGAYQYDKDKTMMQIAKEWGAKEVKFMPYGVCEIFLDKNPDFDKRDIDLIFVGNFQNKTAKILQVFKAFPNMEIHSLTAGWKGIFRTWYHCLKRKKGWYEGINLFDKDLYKMFLKAKPCKDPLELYSRAKVGFNVHQKNGPVNYRTYELPARGVMQVCDNCEGGLKEVFKLDEEVIGYDTTKGAIEKIHYYLLQENERKKIAKAGYDRVMKDYLKKEVFKVLNEI